MTGGFRLRRDWHGTARLDVRWTTSGRDVTDYAVTLTAVVAGRRRTIRVYDGAHGVNEMHRYTLDGGRQPGIIFHEGKLSEGLQAAQVEVRGGRAEMIGGGRR